MVLLMLFALAQTAHADEHAVAPERARAAVEKGQIMPLASLLGAVEGRFVGTVVEAELQENLGSWIYELEFLPIDGRLYRVFVDAATAAVVRTEGPVQERSGQERP